MENKGFILILIGVILLIGNMFFVFASNDFIDDGDIMPFSHDYVDYKTSSQKGANTEVYLGFERFDVYINSEYYNANTPEIDDFFTEFEERYLILEDLTGWSAEEFYDKKLEIHVTESVGCYGGGGGSGYVSLRFSDPLYMQGCQNK